MDAVPIFILFLVELHPQVLQLIPNRGALSGRNRWLGRPVYGNMEFVAWRGDVPNQLVALWHSNQQKDSEKVPFFIVGL